MPDCQTFDIYSDVAATYARARPSYPDELYQWLVSIAPSREHVWDCGTGTGQAAHGLARYFDRVIATDISLKQITEASRIAKSELTGHRISFRVAPADNPGIFEARNFDLVTAATTYHWYPDHAAFLRQTQKLAKPDGIIALWAYPTDPRTGVSKIDSVIDKFGAVLREPQNALPEHKLVDERYRTIYFPTAKELTAPSGLRMRAFMTADDLADYYATQSAVRNMENRGRREGTRFIEALKNELTKAWSNPDSARLCEWPVDVRAAKVGDLRL